MGYTFAAESCAVMSTPLRVFLVLTFLQSLAMSIPPLLKGHFLFLEVELEKVGTDSKLLPFLLFAITSYRTVITLHSW